VSRGLSGKAFAMSLFISKMFAWHRRFRLAILLTSMSVFTRVSSAAIGCHREPYLVRASYNFGDWWDPEFVELIRPKNQGCNFVLQTTENQVGTSASVSPGGGGSPLYLV
jgi:hypothetical protein